MTPLPADPYIWLEEASSPRAMAWVKEHNAVTEQRLTADPRYKTLYEEALALGGAKDRIPQPSFLNGAIYNFWQDADHLRGIWRKTTLDSYRTASPAWTTVLDIDALGKAEGKSWVFKDVDCLRPAERLCVVSLSDGGEDAVVVREFDLDTGKFVAGGFNLPRGKHRIEWQDENHLLVASEWTPGDLTPSGYPYIVKRLARGQALADAVEVYRGGKTDGGYGVSPGSVRDGKGRSLFFVVRPLDTFHHETWVLTPRGVERLAIPSKADIVAMVDGRVIVSLDETMTSGGATFRAGSVVALDLDAVLATPGALKPSLVWQPGPRDALNSVRSSKDLLLLSTLDNVRGRALVLRPAANGGWTTTTLDLPDNLAVGFGSADDNSNLSFLNVSGFLTPSSLLIADAAAGKVDTLKTLPAKFDAAGLVVEQRSATSTDGTKIPYFIVHKKDIKRDGTTPTLLSAYGGFQVSRTPSYSPELGKLWLERGGAYVLANIRGGGEFGPAWHEAGLLTKRQIIYDDFASVARDLIATKVTSPRRLGIQGGSNGGLLTGVQMIQQPDLWTAVVIDVPLLDMLRISKIAAGASWQGEYGDVNADPAVRAFWLKTSPYHNLKKGVRYPEPYIFTTSKDDRTGPQHARKFAARMEEMGLPFYFYENTEGGHGSGADLKQAAHTRALTMTYLHKKLVD
nr:prolyl oligopeptidase family serine peptidase [Glacieibacterium frigidum]